MMIYVMKYQNPYPPPPPPTPERNMISSYLKGNARRRLLAQVSYEIGY